MNLPHSIRYLFLGGLVLLLIGIYQSCVAPGPSLQDLAVTNPDLVVARQDSLLAKRTGDPQLVATLVEAHLSIAQRERQADPRSEKAREHFQAALALNDTCRDAKYGLVMIEGLRLFKLGGRMDLWDALEQFGRAATLRPKRGEPHVWMARAYEKKDDDDFDLILERYNQALSLNLPPDLKAAAEAERTRIRERKDKLESFWNQ